MPSGRKDIYKDSKPFTSENQPDAETVKKRGRKISEAKQKKRELTELLNLALKGQMGDQINYYLKDQIGVEAKTIEEALHFVQISKAITKKDTQAYSALMTTSGLNKPIKTEIVADLHLSDEPIVFK